MLKVSKSFGVLVLILTLTACDSGRRSALVSEVPDAQAKLDEQEATIQKYNDKIDTAKRATEKLRNAAAKIQLLLSQGKAGSATPVDFLVTLLEGFKNGYIPDPNSTEEQMIERTQTIDMSGLGFKNECASYESVLTLDPKTDVISITISGCTTGNQAVPLMTTSFVGLKAQTVWNQAAINGIFRKAVNDAHVALGDCEFADQSLACSKMSFLITDVGIVNINSLSYNSGQDIALAGDYDINGDTNYHYLLQVTSKGKVTNTKVAVATVNSPIVTLNK